MEIGELALQQYVIVIGARNIARTAGTGPAGFDRRHHRRTHFRVLAHAQIVIGAPDGDLFRPRRSMPRCPWDRRRRGARYR